MSVCVCVCVAKPVAVELRCHATALIVNILRINSQNKTKFCIHIIIDKIYVGIINHCFLQICNRVTAFSVFTSEFGFYSIS